jgi:hypothetical protein
VPLKEEEEYRFLYAAMVELREKCEERRAGVLKLLLELDELRENAVKEISRVNGLGRRLSAYHQREMGFLRVKAGKKKRPSAEPVVPLNDKGAAMLEPVPAPAPAAGFANRRELKIREIETLSKINELKKTLLQLDLLELRCRELLVSIAKALEAFSHEFKTAKREIYPFSIFSRILKNFRSLWGGPYYTPGDLRVLATLGVLAVHIIDMAETPVI